MDFHTILMEARGRATGASALEAAVSIGLDQEAIETAMGDTEVGATLEEVALLSRHLGINGTPAYVVGDEVRMGAVGCDRLKAQIDDTRNCGEATC